VIADLATGASLSQTFVINNIIPTGGSLGIDIFNYNDTDLDASAGTDSAFSLGGTSMEISETSTSLYEGVGAAAYAVDTFPNVRNLFSHGQ